MKLRPTLPSLLILGACAGPPPVDADACATPYDPEAHTTLVVGTTTQQYDAGTISLIDLQTGTVCDDVATTSPDSIVTVADGGSVLDVGRLGTDRIAVYEPPDWQAPAASFAVERGANPQDAVWCAGAWWVSQLGRATLPAYDAEGRRVAAVDLSPWADADGLPEASALETDGTLLDVALQRLDRTDRWEPSGPGRIVRIDCERAAVLGDVPAPRNPGLTRRGEERVIFGELRLETWDGRGAPQPWIDTPDPPTEVRFSDSGHGLVVTRTEHGWHQLYCIDPGGELNLLGHTDAYLNQAAAVDTGLIWVTARSGWADPDHEPVGERIPEGTDGEVWEVDPQACSLQDRVELRLLPYSIDVY